MRKNAILVSAADDKFFPLLQGLVSSVRRAKEIADLPIIVLDVGLNADGKGWLNKHSAKVVRVDWDFESLAIANVPEFFKAQAWRPFLPRHLPDAQVYVWMDADTWVQDEQAILLAIECACERPSIVVVPEISRFYQTMYGPGHEFRTKEASIYRTCFGKRLAYQLTAKPLINSGFFAMARSSEYWTLWADVLREMYRRVIQFYTEQCSLNVSIYARNMKWVPLPAYCNWICCHALPAFDEDRHRYVEPGSPHQEIRIMHLAGPTKTGEHQISTSKGRTITRSLRFSQEQQE